MNSKRVQQMCSQLSGLLSLLVQMQAAQEGSGERAPPAWLALSAVTHRLLPLTHEENLRFPAHFY